MVKTIQCKILFTLLSIAATAATSPLFAIDLLELPAVQSKAATSALLLDVTSRGDGAFVAVGEYGVIIVSEDGGESWEQASVPASPPPVGLGFGRDGSVRLAFSLRL